MAALSAAFRIDSAIEAHDEANRLWRVAPEDEWNWQPDVVSKTHHDIFVDNGRRTIITHVVGLENVCRWFAADGLKEYAIAVDDQEFVLCASQRHAFGGAAAEGRAGQVANTSGNLLIGYRPEAAGLVAVLVGREQDEGAGRLGSQILEQREGIIAMDLGFLAERFAHLLFRQEIVEIPLDGAFGATVLMQDRLSAATRAKGRSCPVRPPMQDRTGSSRDRCLR